MKTGAKKAMSDQENQSEVELSAPVGSAKQLNRDRGRRRNRNQPRNLEASINMDELRELIGLITTDIKPDTSSK